MRVRAFLVLVGGMAVASTTLAAAGTGLQAALPPRPEPKHGVTALAVVGKTVYVGGDFRTMEGAPRERLAAFDAVSGELKPWAPSVAGRDLEVWVNDIVVSGDTVYVSGNFEQVNGIPRKGLAALDADTGELKAWDPQLKAAGYTSGHWCWILPCPLAVAAGKVYVGGVFPRGGFVAIDAGDARLKNWSANASRGSVTSIAIAGNRLYVAGDFRRIRGRARGDGTMSAGLAALDRRTLKVTSWKSASGRRRSHAHSVRFDPLRRR